MGDRKRNIFFLSDNFPPERNAAASRVSERGVYWVKQGHKMSVLTSFPNFPEGRIYDGYRNSWYKRGNHSGIDVFRVKTFIAPNSGFLFRVLDFLSYMITSFIAGLFLVRKDHDVIIATSPQLFTAVSAWALSRVKRKPFVFELGDLWPESIKAVGALNRSFLLRSLERVELFLYREAKVIIALTESFKKNLIERGIPAEKIHVVRNGVDLSMHHSKPLNHQLRSSLGLDGKFVIGYIGTLGMAHDLGRVIELASLLQKKGSRHIAFLFVGSGADKENLIKRSEGLELDNVIFVDSQPKDKIGEYWGIIDMALAHVRNAGTFGNVIPSKMFEAMAYGRPILLIAPEGEAVEIIRRSKSGVCLTDYDFDAFISTVERLSRDTQWLEAASAAAKESSRLFTRERQSFEFMQVIDHICR